MTFPMCSNFISDSLGCVSCLNFTILRQVKGTDANLKSQKKRGFVPLTFFV